MAVDGPPLLVQYLQEVGGVVAADGQAAREGGVDMVVRVDEARHDHAAPRVHEGRVGVFGAQRLRAAHFGNQVALNGNAAIFQEGAVYVTGDKASVSQQIHVHSPFRSVVCDGMLMSECSRCRARRVSGCSEVGNKTIGLRSCSPCAKHSVTAACYQDSLSGRQMLYEKTASL